jgi:hypothetical protein
MSCGIVASIIAPTSGRCRSTGLDMPYHGTASRARPVCIGASTDLRTERWNTGMEATTAKGAVTRTTEEEQGTERTEPPRAGEEHHEISVQLTRVRSG